MINTNHPKYKDLDEDTILAINVGHASRDYIESIMKLDVSVLTLKTCYQLWLENERSLQKLWGFEENDNYIKWWNVPKCGCPKLDNEDAYPTGYYTTSGNCLIHGKEFLYGD